MTTRAETQPYALKALCRVDAKGIEYLMRPLPRQREALDALYRGKYILYGGAAGPGKSHWLRWSALHFAIHCSTTGVPGVRVGLFCEDYPSLTDRQISRIVREFPEWLGKLRRTDTEGFGFRLHDSYGGGMIALRNLDDPSKYASTEFAAEFVDELTKNPRQTFDDLRFRLRWPGVEHTPFVGATNPTGIGYGWVKKLWVDRDFSGDDSVFDPDDFVFIRALPKDNPYLGTSYWEQLDTLPEAMRRALRDGDWDVFAGQVFSEWRRELHVVKPFVIPGDWTRWGAIDYGFASPFCALFFARSPDRERIYVYRELYAKGLRAEEQAQRIGIAKGTEAISGGYWADPSMWQKREGVRGNSIAEEYLAAGLMLRKANNDRLAGWGAVHEGLAWQQSPIGEMIRTPRVQIFESCVNLIRTLPALPYDDNRVEDVDTDVEDHAPDGLRYGLMAERQWARAALPASVPMSSLSRVALRR